MFIKKIGIDLGTVNTLIYIPKKGIVLNEPSLVVFGDDNNKPLAMGKKAKEMIGRTPEEIRTCSPLRNGVIADYKTTEIMLNYFINKAIGPFQFLKPDVIISVPAGISSSERRAVMQATLHIGAKNVYLVKEPLLAAIGAEIKINQPSGHMIVDIGGGTSEVAVISLGSIVTCASVKIGGVKITEKIINYIRKKYNLEIGFSTAERIKIQASQPNDKKNNNRIIEVKGQDMIDGLPSVIEIQENELYSCVNDALLEITRVVKNVLQETPPELSADILEEGITLTGGGSLIKGLSEIIHTETGILCYLANDPLICVIRGIGYALQNLDIYKKALLSKKPL